MTRAQMKYDPNTGFKYMPGMKTRVQTPNGGYLVRTNDSGYRSDQPFPKQRTNDSFRILLFGDSQTAGDGVSNSKRYSDRLNSAIPQCEIYNYAVSGTGTDQQYLSYLENLSTEHDLIVIGLYVENIRRINRSLIKSREADDLIYYYPKPYFTLAQSELELHNVPAPKDKWTENTLPNELRSDVYSPSETSQFNLKERSPFARKIAPYVPFKKHIRSLIARATEFEPLPGYDSAETSEWLLMRAILKQWINKSTTPVLLVTIPHHLYFSVPAANYAYQARFKELVEETGCHHYDVLPDFLNLPKAQRDTLWSEEFEHFSEQGHERIAELLKPVIAGVADL